MRKLFVCTTLLLCSLYTILFSQNNNFRQWSIKDGLPQSNIYCIRQDQRGYLWIGTGGGVCSFDGKNFRTYTKKEGLSGNTVRSIMEDSQGRLWFGTDEGITIYDGYQFRTIGKQEGISGSTVLCFIEDFQKNIWAGTDDGGINKITPVEKDSFVIDVFSRKQGLSDNAVFDLYEDKNHTIWAATFGGINILHPSGNKYEIKIIKGQNNIPSDKLLSISADNKGNLWFGTYDAGAFKLAIKEAPSNSPEGGETKTDGTGRTPSPLGRAGEGLVVYNTSNGLNGNSVWDILFTSTENIWFGTAENGINRFIPVKGTSKYRIDSYTPNQGVSSNQILCLFEDNEGDLWIGSNGDGLCMLPGDQFAHYTMKDGLPNNKIQSIKQDTNGVYWLASDGGGLTAMDFSKNIPGFKTYTEKEGLSSNFTTSIAIGKAGNKNIWMGTTNQGIIKFDGKKFICFNEKDRLASNRVNSLLVDSKGIVWCGTAGGISKFDGSEFKTAPTDMMKMGDDGVKAIIEDRKGNIWFGTAGGLARYAGNGTLRTFDEVEGLKSKDVNSLVEGPDGNIWIGTNSGGIYKFNINKNDTSAIEFVADDSLLSSNSIHALMFQDNKTLIAGTYKGFDKLSFDDSGKLTKVRNYNSTDGFIGVECNDNAVYKDNQGNIWFGTVKGLTRYSPSLEKNTTSPPKIHITGLQLFYKNVDWSSKSDRLLPWFNLPSSLILPYDKNNLTFRFSAISFNNPDKTEFRYILEGRDNDWSPPRATNEVTFSGLSKGIYTFKVMAVDANGNWSEPSVFSLTITPPWYETKWFYLVCTATIALSFYTYVKSREKKLQKEKRILEKTVAERTKEVVMQKDQIAEKNREITDSINYAKRIQSAILPDLKDVKKAFPNSFILFKPKDIVSGDFYWYQPDHGMIAAADCTGHGVPGAFMSTIGVEKLNEAVKHASYPGEVLQLLNRAIKTSLRQSEEADINEKATRDGMDIAIVSLKLNGDTAKLCYSGANRPFWLIRKNSIAIEEIKATKNAIGGLTDDNQVFDTHELQLQPEDTFYIFSDGYADQFSSQDKKLMTKRFKEALLGIQNKTMNEQKEYLESFIENWKGHMEQTDDVLVIGIRI